MTSVTNEKGENLNIYDAKNVVKLERALTERAGSSQERRGRGQAKWSTGSAPGSTSDSSISRDLCPLTGMGETASMASIESPASTGSEGAIREGFQEKKVYPVKKKKPSLEKLKNTSHQLIERSQSKTSNTIILIDDEILSPVRKGFMITDKTKNLKSDLFRRQEQAFFSHVERTRNPSGGSASGKKTLDPNSISKALPQSSPKNGKRSITGPQEQPKKGWSLFSFI